MKKRALQVRFVKTTDENQEQPAQNDRQFEDSVEVINKSIDRMIRKVGLFAIGFVVLDTARQVLVAKANQK